MTQSLWDEAANRFRSVASKVVTTGLGDRPRPAPAPAPQTAPLAKSYGAERVQMAEAGGPIVAADPNLKAAIAPFASDGDAMRGFMIGVGTVRTKRYTVAEMRGGYQRDDKDPAHLARVLRGFDAGVAAAGGAASGLTQSSLVKAPAVTSEPTILGLPQTTVIAGVGVLAAAGVATYFLRPQWLGLKTSGDRSRRRYGRSRSYAYSRKW